MSNRIVIMNGPPFSGKGTYSRKLSEILQIPYISVGDLVREKLENDISWFGEGYTQKDYNEGKLVPDYIISKAIINKIKELDNNCILDGFPRTIEQCETFVQEYKNQYIIVDISQDINVLVDRASNRRICPNCNEIYALGNPNMLPNTDNTCVKCGVEVIQRKDDEPSVVVNRINAYSNTYAPIVIKLLENTKKGINLLPGNMQDINIIVNILSSYITMSDIGDFKILIQIYDNL